MKKAVVLSLIALCALAFTYFQTPSENEKPQYIEPSVQRSGDANLGFQYLVTGDYLKSGLPLSIFQFGTPKDSNNFLKRTGLNSTIPFDFTAVKAANGETVVAPNCLQCHGQVFDGKLVVGLGNALTDYTVNREGLAVMAENMLKKLPGNAKKYEAAAAFLRAVKMISPKLVVPVKGVNVADVLAALLVSHRNPQTLEWSDVNLLQLPDDIVPTDVPAWWLLKKKHAMFYNGFGRGDFGRFLMASNLLTVTDTAEAREVDGHFNDVLAYIQQLQAPKYPKPIDQGLAKKGEIIFNNNCSGCHGTYGANGKYPNLLIPESIIQTDSLLYSSNYSNPQFVNWFNNSWFTTGDHPAKLVPYQGYIAPPLDGIWITAPYLHNGSVPNLEALLNSKKRPQFWKRNFTKPEYNYDVPGYVFEATASAKDKETYNTTLKGYGNQGHYFGDRLTDKERKALIEYLKTL